MSNLKEKIKRTLLFFQRYAKIDMLYTTKGAFWITVDHIVIALTGLALTVVLANLLETQAYGTYKYILAIAGIIELLLFKGIEKAITQSTAQGDEGSFQTIVYFKLRWGFIFSLACIIVAGYAWTQGNVAIPLSLIAIGLLRPFTASFILFKDFINGKKDFATLTLYSVTGQIIVSLSTIAALFITKNLVALFIVSNLIGALSSAFFYHLTIKKYKPKTTQSDKALSYGKHLSLMGIIGSFVGNIDSIILFHVWGASTLAQYAIASSIPNHGYSYLKTSINLFIPKLAKRNTQSIARTFYIRIGQMLALGTCIGIAYATIAPLLFSYLFPQYQEIVKYSQWLGIDIALALPAAYTGSVFISQKYVTSGYIASILPNIIRMGLYILFGIVGGLGGMILAFILSRIISLIINIALWEIQRRRYPKKIKTT